MSTDNLARLDKLKNPEKYEREEKVWNSHQKPETPRGKWQNFWYHYKWHTFGIIAGVCLLAFFIHSIVTQEKHDYRFMLVTQTTVGEQGLTAITDGFSAYAEDLNGDEKANVSVMAIEMGGDPATANPQMAQANSTKYMAELQIGEVILFIVDQKNYDASLENGLFTAKNGEEAATKETPMEDVAYSLKDTSIAKALAEQGFTEELFVCFRVVKGTPAEKKEEKTGNSANAHALFDRFAQAEGIERPKIDQ